jgi:hypothetical protein
MRQPSRLPSITRCSATRATGFVLALGVCLGVCMTSAPASAQTPARTAVTPPGEQVDDVHLHLTNYIQEGTDIHQLLAIMGDRVSRAAVFGIPLQQEWSYRVSGTFAPTYYLDSDSPLYYYSFIDAIIAMAYRSLTPAEQARLDPMICGFNPADMYAADQIRRVLLTFPGVFSGIGEFSIHKEFVTAKVAGGVPSLTDPALDRILDFAAESGLVVILHNDVDRPFPKAGADPLYFRQVKALFRRHPKATIIWAHMGLGRVIQPIDNYAHHLGDLLADPRYANVYFDLSWAETAKYIVASGQSIQIAADLINRYPDRFLYGSDEVAPDDQKSLLQVYDAYAPLWNALTPRARQLVLQGNYERIFDHARLRVRAWEQEHKSPTLPPGPAVRPRNGD